MATQADYFAEARGGTQSVILRDNRGGYQDQRLREPEKFGTQKGGNFQSGKGSYRSDKQCFTCKEFGHITHNSTKRKSFVQKVAVAIESRAWSGDSKREGLPCKGSEPNNASRVYKFKSHVQVDHDEIMSIGTCLFLEARVPTGTGTANGQTVTVVRDTGCMGVVVKRSLVREDQMHGWKSLCMLLNQTIDRVPVAKIEIETPFLTWTVEALCMDNPIYDLTIGNVDGSRLPTLSDFRFPIEQAVQIRAQTDKKPLLKLKVLEAVTDISRDEFTREQIRDGSLSKFAEKILSGTAKYCKGGGSSKFVRTKSLMYREFSPRDVGKYLQLVVVPQVYRSHVLRLAHESSMAGHLGI
ncbi:hypothetical protein ACJMK2_014613 [Sinanodonta woodiana]|uniref:Integrase zinc-binding domain-containing protein n=1 Tax=Sinanodonta woodiana TaxID=1069815 RepID=A0ABD3V1J5_SINWO